MMDFGELRRVLAAFEREGVRYVLVGSMAMAAQGIVRLFDDDPNVDEITAADLGGDYPAVEYTPPHGRYSMDILSRLGEAFRYDELEAEDVIVEGVRARVATPRMLYRMKKDTVRPQDRMDAETIRTRFGLKEE
jgi:hypothetical protein